MDSEPKRRLSGTSPAKHRHLLLKTLLPAVVDHPFERLTLVSLARISGVSLWVLRGAFGNAHTLLSAVTAQAMDAALADLDYPGGEKSSVADAIGDYARFLAAKMQSTSYRNLLLILIRNGSTVNWVTEAYNDRIVAKICRDLETAIRVAGGRHGMTILLKEGAARRFYKRIEAVQALPTLVPGPIEWDAHEIDLILDDIAREVFAATYAFEWEDRPKVAPAARMMPRPPVPAMTPQVRKTA